MVSQNIQTIQYAETMVEGYSAPKSLEHHKAEANHLFTYGLYVFLLICIPLAVQAVFNGVNTQKDYVLQGLRTQVTTMAKENDVMKLEVSKLEAPVRIQQIAETKLHMHLPERTIYGEADPVIPEKNKGR